VFLYITLSPWSMISVNNEQVYSVYKLQRAGRIYIGTALSDRKENTSNLRLKSMPQTGFENAVPMFKCESTCLGHGLALNSAVTVIVRIITIISSSCYITVIY
jgi:hypothetical protein